MSGTDENRGMDLATFLLARIAEDEADARRAKPGPWTYDGDIVTVHGGPADQVVDWVYDDSAEHIARWDPVRVLAECDAKRRLVDEAAHQAEHGDYGAHELGSFTLALLALPYAEHPDYRDEWRP